MRIASMIAGVVLVASNAATAASADYYLKIDAVGRDSPDGTLYLKAHSTGDLDGDGVPDDAVIRLTCAAGNSPTAEFRVTGPRDSASGQASGKRMHKPLTIVKEWDAASPQLMAMKAGYDVKKMEGARTMATDDWSPIALSDAQALCAQGQADRATKTRSNIQNN